MIGRGRDEHIRVLQVSQQIARAGIGAALAGAPRLRRSAVCPWATAAVVTSAPALADSILRRDSFMSAPLERVLDMNAAFPP